MQDAFDWLFSGWCKAAVFRWLLCGWGRDVERAVRDHQRLWKDGGVQACFSRSRKYQLQWLCFIVSVFELFWPLLFFLPARFPHNDLRTPHNSPPFPLWLLNTSMVRVLHVDTAFTLSYYWLYSITLWSMIQICFMQTFQKCKFVLCSHACCEPLLFAYNQDE